MTDDHHIERQRLSETRLQLVMGQTAHPRTGLEEMGLSSPDVQFREQYLIGELF
jgi:hypothetical protein